MQWIGTILALGAGLILRLGLPIALTILAIALLRRLDARWQSEAGRYPVQLATPCWEIKNCTPEQRTACSARESGQPCWQTRRLANGYLREECLTCEVFEQAPVPVRM
jgi:hypothetical protein